MDLTKRAIPPNKEIKKEIKRAAKMKARKQHANMQGGPVDMELGGLDEEAKGDFSYIGPPGGSDMIGAKFKEGIFSKGR